MTDDSRVCSAEDDMAVRGLAQSRRFVVGKDLDSLTDMQEVVQDLFCVMGHDGLLRRGQTTAQGRMM